MARQGAEAVPLSLVRPWSAYVVGKIKHRLSEAVVKPREVQHLAPVEFLWFSKVLQLLRNELQAKLRR